MRPRPKHARVRKQRLGGRAAWQILNAIFTMFKLGKRGCGSARPAVGRTVNHSSGELAVDGGGRLGDSRPGGARRSSSRACSACIGLPKYQPWPIAQPSRTTVLNAASFSMPSTHTGTENRIGKGRDRANDREAFALDVDVADEAAVDLDDVERQRTQVRQRREAGPEIIQREADALVLEAGDDAPRELDIRKQRALGDLDHQPFRGERRLRRGSDDALCEPAIGELGRRDVDRYLDLRIPRRGFAKRFARSPVRTAVRSGRYPRRPG